ncbi:hypothetical protein OG900_34625 [Streptomyces sp. NBC_00433]
MKLSPPSADWPWITSPYRPHSGTRAHMTARGVPLSPFRPFPSRPLSRPPARPPAFPRGPLPVDRLVKLYAGLVLYGVTDALVIRADLGLDPWDVFHQGLSRHTGISIGTVSILVGAVVLLLWWPIRQRPGLGTVSNVVLVGASIDATCALVPHVEALAARVPLLLCGVLFNGVATGLYIAARFGPGPRDGLMTGLHRRTGRSLRLIRTGIELTVLVAGFLLGGGVGVGTVLYALAIGPLAQFFLRVFGGSGAGSHSRVGAPTAPVPRERAVADTI